MKKLNFGCGEHILEGYDNCDIQKYPGVISFDFDKFPYPIKDNTYDYVLAEEVLEHLYNVEECLEELHRICKPNATIEILTPHYSNKGAFNSLQHKHYFSERAFSVFADDFNVLNKKGKFKIIKLEQMPSSVGKFIHPYWLRQKLALFLNGIVSRLHIIYKVVK